MVINGMPKTAAEFMQNMMESRRRREIADYGRELTQEERDKISAEREARLIAEQQREREENQRAKAKLEKEWLDAQIQTIPTRFREGVINCDFWGRKKDLFNKILGKSAVIYGDNSVGKTFIAWSLVFDYWKRQQKAIYMPTYKLFARVKASFDDGSTENVIKGYIKAPFLVIDEIGKTYGTQMEYSTLFEIVNERYDWMLPTLLITNSKEDEIVKTIGKSTFCRIGNAGYSIELTGEDNRRGEDR